MTAALIPGPNRLTPTQQDAWADVHTTWLLGELDGFCDVDSCPNLAVGRGLCTPHLDRVNQFEADVMARFEAEDPFGPAAAPPGQHGGHCDRLGCDQCRGAR